MAFARLTEFNARGASDVSLLEQDVGDSHRILAQAGEAHEKVERALRRVALDARDGVERRDHEVAAGPVGQAHFFHHFLRPVEGGDASGHGKRGRRGHGLTLQIGGQVDNRLGASSPAQAPAGHGIGFGVTVQSHGTFGHAGQSGQADMFAFEDQFFVHLV